MSNAAVKTFSLQPQTPPLATALPWLEGCAALSADKIPDWARALRSTGAEAFARSGLPTPAWERWKYTNLRALDAAAFRWSPDAPKVDAAKLPAPLFADTYRLVLVNGQYQASLSNLPAQATVTNLLDTAGAEDFLVNVGQLAEEPMIALNSAYLRDGAVLKVPANTDLDKPVEVLFFNTGEGMAVYPRMLYWLGVNSGATIIERHMGEGRYFANHYGTAVLERDSRLKLYRLVDETPLAHHYNYTLVHQQKGSQFEGFSSALGYAAGRQEFRLQLLDDGISSTIGGIYLLQGKQNHDFTVLADHFEPNGMSDQHFKGVIHDEARAVFQGKTKVHRPAQKTDAYQSHHALLLSDRAEANAKPELEIYADDVKCSHGATAGYMDPKALFYLRSRGIPLEEARALLIRSFVDSSIDRITFEPLKDVYRAKVDAWLESRHGS